MIQQRRVMSIPAILSVRYRAPAAASALPWYLAGGAPAPIAVYQPKGAASLAASYVNLVTPGTYDAAPGVTPTLDASGWVFNGSSQYLTTGVVPQVGWTALVRFSNLGGGSDKALWGVYDTGSTTAFAVTGQTFAMRSFAGTNQDHSPRLNAGVHGIAGKTVYRDGVADAPNIGAGSATINRAIFIGALDLFGNPAQYGASKTQAFAIWNTSTNHAVWMPAVMAAVALI